ncbi:MAG: YbaB/EbfC family nucleoid-associated protein [Patescibacteria group bacterium]|nr:YbaB/EbfC family nucleoid-associated protein [Patescibacteria group bacterium]MBU1953056.1 YbaB/EbfC family nucleoid-associated protein [Patescibacteria group bacterium]
MFDKIKELNRLKQTQSRIKKQMEEIFATKEKGNVRIVVRGDKKIQKLEIDGEDKKDLRELINDVFGEVDKKVEKQMRGQLKDLGLPDL